MDRLKIRLTFIEEKEPFLLDVSSLFYDFELLHDFFLLLYAENYSNYKFNRFFWLRKGRPIRKEHKIRVLKIKKDSPLTIEIIVGLIVGISGAFWAIVQAIEKIRSLRSLIQFSFSPFSL